ncbi:MAG: DUF4248 domain-containing protein [Prevotella sp.]|nr:DUF4248 domain-containing protein [Prevotella sp.]
MIPFEIKRYGKSELARLYCPHTKTKKGALNNLKFWIRTNPDLPHALQSCGTAPCAQHYSPEEVALIAYYLGEP